MQTRPIDPFAGATQASYTTPNLRLNDHDTTYRVFISNSFASLTSNNAKLSVLTNQPLTPVIIQLLDGVQSNPVIQSSLGAKAQMKNWAICQLATWLGPCVWSMTNIQTRCFCRYVALIKTYLPCKLMDRHFLSYLFSVSDGIFENITFHDIYPYLPSASPTSSATLTPTPTATSVPLTSTKLLYHSSK